MVKQLETVSYRQLCDEIDRLIEDDTRFKGMEIVAEALEAVKWWAMEEIVPSVGS